MPFARCYVGDDASGYDLYDSLVSAVKLKHRWRGQRLHDRVLFFFAALTVFNFPPAWRNENESHYIFIDFQFPIRRMD